MCISSVLDLSGEREKMLCALMKRVHFVKALQGSFDDDTVEVVPSSAPVTTEKLWVEKYAPSSFTELLSDEKTNREVV